ncbi:YheC/YheD family protein [Fodinisporobacter ferrooxydans]|uniref:YheC/YheD family protein n=1 Tax=Fodinisporobacter ferrooxydans TaxID=2901836 RepID=A0ABY4CNJ5_9BACL|nr:YheC/YheD family protein [Alicyclobacillaceae bacterium MYW30-H2]
MKQENMIFLKGPPGRKHELFLTFDQMDTYKIKQMEIIELQFGLKRIEVRVIQRHRWQKPEESTIYCTADVLEALQIPEDRLLPIYYSSAKGKLQIGPLVGILAHVRYKPASGVYGEQEPAFRKLLDAANDLGMMGYVFSPLEIEWATDMTWAYQYIAAKEGEGQWRRLKLPLPDVVYDQISTRKFETRANVQAASKRLQKLMQKRFFNQGFFNKWQVHQWLTGDAATSKYVPDSVRYENPAATDALLNRYGNLYLKPIHGSLGIGIIKLTRLADGRIYYQLKQRKKTVQGYAKGTAQALQILKKRQRNHLIVQQGLNLLAYQGRPFDIRVLMQKDGEGKWSRTKMFVRIAKQGEITSNLTTGGDARPIRETLQEMFRDQGKVSQILKDIRSCIKVVPLAIEQQAEISLGELGLDLGIDTNGKLWVIEANAKPWKKTETEHGSLAVVERSFHRPMEYARFLAFS